MSIANFLREHADQFAVTSTAHILFLVKSGGVTTTTIDLGRIKDANLYTLMAIASA